MPDTEPRPVDRAGELEHRIAPQEAPDESVAVEAPSSETASLENMESDAAPPVEKVENAFPEAPRPTEEFLAQIAGTAPEAAKREQLNSLIAGAAKTPTLKGLQANEENLRRLQNSNNLDHPETK